jgi:hypothetical protein
MRRALADFSTELAHGARLGDRHAGRRA